VQQFEKSLVIDITEVNNKLQSTNGSTFCQYKKLLLTASGCADLENLVASFQRGLYVAMLFASTCRISVDYASCLSFSFLFL